MTSRLIHYLSKCVLVVLLVQTQLALGVETRRDKSDRVWCFKCDVTRDPNTCNSTVPETVDKLPREECPSGVTVCRTWEHGRGCGEVGQAADGRECVGGEDAENVECCDQEPGKEMTSCNSEALSHVGESSYVMKAILCYQCTKGDAGCDGKDNALLDRMKKPCKGNYREAKVCKMTSNGRFCGDVGETSGDEDKCEGGSDSTDAKCCVPDKAPCNKWLLVPEVELATRKEDDDEIHLHERMLMQKEIKCAICKPEEPNCMTGKDVQALPCSGNATVCKTSAEGRSCGTTGETAGSDGTCVLDTTAACCTPDPSMPTPCNNESYLVQRGSFKPNVTVSPGDDEGSNEPLDFICYNCTVSYKKNNTVPFCPGPNSNETRCLEGVKMCTIVNDTWGCGVAGMECEVNATDCCKTSRCNIKAPSKTMAKKPYSGFRADTFKPNQFFTNGAPTCGAMVLSLVLVLLCAALH